MTFSYNYNIIKGFSDPARSWKIPDAVWFNGSNRDDEVRVF